jgi:hypothetical protein
MNDQILMTNPRSLILTKSTYTPRAKVKMRTKIMVKNTYILVKRARIWMRLRGKGRTVTKKRTTVVSSCY